MPVRLREVQRIPTSGARAAETLTVDGLTLVAIPQLAIDLPGPAAMNGGDSDTQPPAAPTPGRALRAAGDASGIRRGGRRVLHHRRSGVPGRGEHPVRAGPVQLHDDVDDPRVVRLGVPALPVDHHLRGQAVPALDDRLAALPRSGPGPRPATRRGRQPPLDDLRVAATAGSRSSRRSPRPGPTTGSRSPSTARRSWHTPTTSAPAGSTRGTELATSPTRTCWPAAAARSRTGRRCP